jgi:teichuronic acid biosynthesis glycosyltransferase TuaC
LTALRILTVTNRWPKEDHHGGIFVQQLVNALRRAGHDLEVELVNDTRGKADYILAAPRVRRRASAGDYDIVHIHYGLSAPAARLIKNVPRVITLYGSDINVWRQRLITKLSWGGCAARMYMSSRLAATARDPSGIIIPNGVDFDRFTPGDRQAARRSLGARPGDLLVLFGGYPAKRVKGWDIFSEVLTQLQARGIPVQPLVLSEPGQSTDRVIAKLDAADLLLFTSRQGSEGSPTVVKEAIVMGLPVVAVDVGDVAELLAGVEPSAVVAFPAEADATRARAELVERLALEAASVLSDGRRANGRQRCAWLALDATAARVEAVYRTVLRA